MVLERNGLPKGVVGKRSVAKGKLVVVKWRKEEVR